MIKTISFLLVLILIRNVVNISLNKEQKSVDDYLIDELNRSESLNISNNVIPHFIKEENLIEPSDREILNENSKEDISNAILIDVAAQNSGISNDLNAEKTMILVTLPDSTLTELNPKVEETIQQLSSHTDSIRNQTNPKIVENEDLTGTAQIDLEEKITVANVTQSIANETKQVPDDIPSFSEWAQQRLEEAEKNKEFLNESVKVNGNAKAKSTAKIRWKNYASPDCGAKVVAANSEAVSPSAILSPSKDEYKLNNCNNRIWFIVELCEPIQAKRIEIGNFELFSSSPKEFTVLIGDRFPNRDWSVVGQFSAKDERAVQSFDLQPHLFGRYVKVEVKSYHGSHHFCTITLFRVFGTSELEVLQKEELVEAGDADYEDDDLMEPLESSDSEAPSKNILNSATDAVYSMIKKAAAVLGNKGNYTEATIEENTTSAIVNSCTCPKHNVICVDCSDQLFGETFELLSCKRSQIEKLVFIPFISRSVIYSGICMQFGINLVDVLIENYEIGFLTSYVSALFPMKTICALCNHLSVLQNISVLNISQEGSLDMNFNKSISLQSETETLLIEPKTTPEPGMLDVEESIPKDLVKEIKIDVNIIDTPSLSKMTDSTIISQIKPTKMISVNNLNESAGSVKEILDESKLDNTNIIDIPISTSPEDLSISSTISTTPPLSSDKTEDDQTPALVTLESKKFDTNEALVPGNVEDPLESLIADGNTGPSPSTTTNNPGQESVFLRLSNRIKTLERNMSLSSQYLEELSKRYKKQVEEMQKLFDKTFKTLEEDNKQMKEKNRELEDKLDKITWIIESNRRSENFYLIVFTTAFICALFLLCVNGSEKKLTSIDGRKSVQLIAKRPPKKVKKRRPSDQAMKIVRWSTEAQERRGVKERKRKRSRIMIHNSNFWAEMSRINKAKEMERFAKSDEKTEEVATTSADWVEENRIIESIPLDESENTALEPLTPVGLNNGIESSQTLPIETITNTNIFATDLPESPKSKSGPSSPILNESNRTRRHSASSRLDENVAKKKRSIKSMLKNVFN